METTETPFTLAIVGHLNELAGKDDLFAKSLSKPNKNITDCCTYILNEVKKSGRQGFADDEIFNMAIHYYDEDTIEIGKPLHAKVVVNRALAAPVSKMPDSTKSKSKKDSNQTSLF